MSGISVCARLSDEDGPIQMIFGAYNQKGTRGVLTMDEIIEIRGAQGLQDREQSTTG